MRYASVPLALLGVLAALLIAPATVVGASGCSTTWSGSGGDWPTAGGNFEQTNHQPAEDRIGTRNVGELQLQWASGPPVDPGQWIPVVAGSCLYVSGSGIIYALDATTGQLIWQSNRRLEYGVDNAGVTYQPRTVTVADGLVHIDNQGSERNPTGNAFDAATGSHVWTSEPILFGYEALQFASPDVFDGMHLIFTTGPDFDPQSRPGYALLDAHTGAVLTSHTTVPQQYLDQGYAGGGVWVDPAIDPVGRYAYAGTSNPYTAHRESPYDNAIIQLDLDRSRSTFGQIVGVYKGDTDVVHPVVNTLPLCSEGSGSGFGCGQLDNDFAASPTLFRTPRGRLLLAELQTSGTLHVIDASTMTLEWKIPIMPAGRGSGPFFGNASMAAYDGSRLYVIANPGNLYALDPDTGTILWASPLQEDSNAMRHPVVANGVVYTIAGSNSTVIAHDATNGVPLAVLTPSFDAGRTCSAQTSGGMALAHHTLYVNCGTYVAAYGLPAGAP